MAARWCASASWRSRPSARSSWWGPRSWCRCWEATTGSPIEVVPFALPLAARRLAPIAGAPTLRQVDGRPFITDNGNVILDCAVGPIADPERLEVEIHTVPGVVGTGLFVGIAHTVLVGEPSGVKELRRRHDRHRAYTSSSTAPTIASADFWALPRSSSPSWPGRRRRTGRGARSRSIASPSASRCTRCEPRRAGGDHLRFSRRPRRCIASSRCGIRARGSSFALGLDGVRALDAVAPGPSRRTCPTPGVTCGSRLGPGRGQYRPRR